jgi:outer membrane immunogenic protein
VLAVSRVALAADLETKAPRYQAVPAAYWTGSYLGIQGGFVRQDGLLRDVDASLDFSEVFNGNKLGGTVGGVLGYNWQHGSFVYGLEGDWSWLGGKATNDGLFLHSSFGADWVATARGRAGLAVDDTLLYLTGGLAFGRVRDNVTERNVDTTPFASFNQDATKVGWTAGLGIEHMLSANWTAKAEFRYVDFGTSRVLCISGSHDCSGSSGEFSNTLMMGLVGLNYKF